MKLFRIPLIAFFGVSLLSHSSNAQESLFQAIQRGDTAAVRQAIDSGVSSSIRDEEGTPLLMLATLFSDAEAVELLLQDGADPNQADASGATALMWAVSDIDKVRLLIDHGADINARSDGLDLTPLLIAAGYPGSNEALELLLDNGADIDATDRTGSNALAMAMRSADVDVMRFLVERGLDANGLFPAAALRSAYGRERPAAIEYLMSQGLPIDEGVLLNASHWQSPELISRWIEQGASVNAEGARYRSTPLITAASSELAGPETLRLLMENGADPNAETSEGERPLDWAIYRANPGKIAVLEEYGAMRGDGPRQETFPPPEPGARVDPRVSIGRSVSLLLASAGSMYERRACITCHHNAVPGVAAALARSKGIAIDEDMAQENLDDILAVFRSAANPTMQGQPAFAGGNTVTLGYSMMALAAEQYPPDKMTAAMTHWSMASQMPNGSWLGNGVNRPPIEYSTVSHTALGVRGLTLYPIPGRLAEIDRALRRARGWLLSAETDSAEERAMRLMGLVWTNAPAFVLEPAIEEILGLASETGGWSQQSELDPDAYATGLTLFALHEAGMRVTDDVYGDGVEFLLRTQYPDGSWWVRTRAFPVQPYFESGFPFGRHQWISAAGTAWATIAIAHTLPDAESRD